MLHISHQVAQPVYHFGNFLMSGTDSSKPALLVQLVADKSLQLLREMGQLLEDGAIGATWLPLLQRVDPSLTEIPVVLVERIVHLTLEGACDFSKRVDVPVQQWPMVIVWLVLRPHNVRCEDRKQCASNLLAADENDAASSVDPTLLKFRALFPFELYVCTTDGVCTAHFWQLIKDLVNVPPAVGISSVHRCSY